MNSKRLYQSSRKEKESRCLLLTASTKREMRHFSVGVVQRRQQRTVQHDALAKLLFFQFKPIAFLPLSLTSPSWSLQERQVFSLLAFHIAYQLIARFMRSDSDYKDGAKRCKQKNSEMVG